MTWKAPQAEIDRAMASPAHDALLQGISAQSGNMAGGIIPQGQQQGEQISSMLPAQPANQVIHMRTTPREVHGRISHSIKATGLSSLSKPTLQ